MVAGDLPIQGKNEYAYFFVSRNLECVGTGDGAVKKFTTKKSPLADRNLDGSVTVADVTVYVGDAKRTNLSAVVPASVVEATGEINFTDAPANGKLIYVSYQYVYGYVGYAQDYSISSSLDTKAITPLSSANEETIETAWKYEGSMKLWNANEFEKDLMCGLDQEDDTVGGTYAPEYPIPAMTHGLVIKRVRDVTKSYIALGTVKVTSFDESASGGDLSEKDIKFDAQRLLREYTPTAGSGIPA